MTTFIPAIYHDSPATFSNFAHAFRDEDHDGEGDGASLFKCGSLLSSTILVCWLSRMRSFGHRCLAAWYVAWASRKSSTSRENVHDVALAINQLD
jgi:hypothetical protein